MKIYISVDMEGISGISSVDYTLRDGRLYAMGQRLATDDASAAVRGAFDGGADEVIVADMHGGSLNLLADRLDPRAKLLAGVPHVPRFPLLDESVDGMVLLGYHAMVGTENATLEHTMNSKSWFKYCVNDVPYGEVSIDAELAAWAGVPVVMVSGDDYLCKEAKAMLGDQIEAAQVKLGLGRQTALCLSPEEGQKRVYEAMKRACERLAAGEKFPLAAKNSPVTVRTTYKFTPDADAAAVHYGARRIDGNTVEVNFPRLADAYGGIWQEHSDRTSKI